MKRRLDVGAAPTAALQSATAGARRGLVPHDGALLRRLARFGAHHGPGVLLRVLPSMFGVAFAAGLPVLRRRVRNNLRRIGTGQSRAREAVDVARTFAQFASCLTEAMVMSRAAPPEVALEVHGEEHLVSVLEQKRGAILVTAHTGGWEIAGPLLAKKFGLEILIAMRRERDPRARAIQDEARARSGGVKVVHVDGEPLAGLPLFTHLRRGGLVGVQIDRALDPDRVLPVTVFGVPGRVPSGPFELARVTGSPVVPVFARRVGYLRYSVTICAAIDVPRSADQDELTRAGARAAAEMTAFLSAHPTHWFDFGA
jgi:lauroyl/myristoyl acyltransferase